MNVIDAARQVLEEAGEPLHYTEITERMIARGLWKPGGPTPSATVNATLSTDIKSRGGKSPFRRVGLGMYASASREVDLLKTLQGEDCGLCLRGTLVESKGERGFRTRTVVDVKPDLACVISAWERLSAGHKQSILAIVREAVTRGR
ncbi:MAG TPA: winged helix-turn-helix domain-containing protein [Phycisphaerae bacterium]|nr:winged helix-turn-helix domain-containing protein [Phycisphaerae bacterium]